MCVKYNSAVRYRDPSCNQLVGFWLSFHVCNKNWILPWYWILHALIVLKWESRHKKCWEWGTRTRMRFMHGIMGTGIPAEGLLRYRKWVPQQLGDMQLPCYQTRESPSSGKFSIFCYRLTYISKMYSMHTKQIVSNPPEKSHRCEAYVCCCPIFGDTS